MARPTNEQRALAEIGGLAATALENMDGVICWIEAEYEIAQSTFDKPRQARLARLSTQTNRVLQAIARIQGQAQNARQGDYVPLPDHPNGTGR